MASSTANTEGCPQVEVAAGLVFRARRLLITQRFSHAHQGGLWEFPGGKREAGESFVECLHRELKEELQIEVAVECLLDTIEHVYPEKTVRLKFYICRWLRSEPRAIGCAAFQWIERTQLGGFVFPPADLRLLSLLRERTDLW